ncbi:uncharacterized protein E0L32_011036 [Thyridium curvatum]|uniref:Peptidase A1 domain-containing protein n=1 Tax=Thyridium curvatum TaxID=1093900 RepID=A0A507AQA1_9PEZI|nr:uncharacterized protein E0L32_011036 [Thyridium curvatum]TPX07048.1 hypothetical protein E0L32_011036 [Thyridium curvatum]
MASLLFAIFFRAAICASEPQPREVIWSKRSYGPDGPWQTVQVGFGSPGQNIDVYPAGSWESLFFAPEICNEPESGSFCFATEAGIYDLLRSDTYYKATQAGPVTDKTFYGTQTLHGDAQFTFDTLTLPGTDIIHDYLLPSHSTILVSKGFRILPNGTRYSASVGNLALGGPQANMSFGLDPNGVLANGTLLTNYMANTNVIPSSSYGLHIGSASLKIPGSLYLGGYDQLRVVGPVSGQSYGQHNLPIDLLDISIGVAVGRSPFNFTVLCGLLAKGNSSIERGLMVEVDAKEPYLYLPKSTCAAIAQNLPVTYSPDFGLYIWNTNDPQYERIVRSPAYLGFTFRANNSVTRNFTINVPFHLLNLNLSKPLSDRPTPYFPCSLPNLDTFRLGRAFMQAAFVSVNWMDNFQGLWFLAQAPGPNLAPAPRVVTIGAAAEILTPSENEWAQSWEGTWSPIEEDGQRLQTSTPVPTATSTPGVTKSQSTSSGLIAGVTVGVVVFLAGLGAGLLLWCRKKETHVDVRRDDITGGNDLPEVDERHHVNPQRMGLLEYMHKNQMQLPSDCTPEQAGSELQGSNVIQQCSYQPGDGIGRQPIRSFVELDGGGVQPRP